MLAPLLLALMAFQPAAAEGAAEPEFFTREGSRLPFSPAVRVGEVLYLSGQIGMAPDGTIPDSMADQARLAMDNLGASLAFAGAGWEDVFKCTVMLDDISQWAAFNEVYVTYFEAGRFPARSAFGADGLALGAGVEVECMAYAPPVDAADGE